MMNDSHMPEILLEGTSVALSIDVSMDTMVYHDGEWVEFSKVHEIYSWGDYVVVSDSEVYNCGY